MEAHPGGVLVGLTRVPSLPWGGTRLLLLQVRAHGTGHQENHQHTSSHQGPDLANRTLHETGNSGQGCPGKPWELETLNPNLPFPSGAEGVGQSRGSAGGRPRCGVFGDTARSPQEHPVPRPVPRLLPSSQHGEFHPSLSPRLFLPNHITCQARFKQNKPNCHGYPEQGC